MLKFKAPTVCTNNWMHTYLINISEFTQQDGKEKTGNLVWQAWQQFCFRNFSAELHPPLNRSFCQRPENINLSEDHRKAHK